MERVRGLLTQYDLDALLVTDLVNIRRLCGFTGSNGLLWVSGEEAIFFTDSRYTLQARAETRGVAVEEVKDLDHAAARLARKRRFGYLGLEAEGVSHARWRRLESLAPQAHWIDVAGGISRLRLTKTDAEVGKLKQAALLAEEAFREAARDIRPGTTEAEVALAFHQAVLRRGADGLSFDTIVASGPQGALPHARPQTRPMEAGELVVFDFGVRLDGYCSDETVTVPVGPVRGEAAEVHEIVRAAQRNALAAIRPGVSLAEVDRAARTTIAEAGYGDRFGHGTGHGVGLDVHEAPTVGPKSSQTAVPGMVFTVEPGIYLPGKFGVRLEDTVCVRDDGWEPVTTLPKTLGAALDA